MIKHYTITTPDGRGSTELVKAAVMDMNRQGLSGCVATSAEVIAYERGKRLDVVVAFADAAVVPFENPPAPKAEPYTMDGMD